MKKTIFICFLILVFLSGCLEVISTRQKQLCLSATHESQTSIFECTKTSECFKKVDSAGFYVSENFNYNIKNQALIYKNNVASAIYYFNNAKTEIQKINNFCDGKKDVDIIKSINNLFFYLSKVFEYQDRSWQKSIELLKDYAIYLKENGVERIAEEEIYDAFVLINQNLNELQEENKLTDNYVSLLKIEAKNANELAKKFGFRKSYMIEYGYVDLYAYYHEYVDDPKKEIKLPIISKSSNHVFSKFSTIENFLRINQSLQGADNYNLYILYDKQFGMVDSLFTKFVALNNHINREMDVVISKVSDLEKKIVESQHLLKDADRHRFEYHKKKYSRKEIGFGFYLEFLKEYYKTIELAEKGVLEKNIEIERIEDGCKEIITEAKKYSNNYFKKIIEEYTLEKDAKRKEQYCFVLRDALNNRNCLEDYHKLVELGLTDDVYVGGSVFDCLEILNQLNYVLENNEKIVLLKKIIVETEQMLTDLRGREFDFLEELKIIDYAEKVQYIKKQPNHNLILRIDEITKELIDINEAIKKIKERIISQDITNNYVIAYEGGGYFLIYENFENNIKNACFLVNEDIESLSSKLKITNKTGCVSELYSGTNKFAINYKNTRTIHTKLIELDIENSLFETIVKNTATGVSDTLNLGQLQLVDNVKYILDSQYNIYYKTEKENKILYYKKIFANTALPLLASALNADFLIEEKYKLKNLLNEKICGKIVVLRDCYDCVAIVKENSVLRPPTREGGHLKINVCFEAFEEKFFEISKVVSIQEVVEKIEELRLKINVLVSCEFEDIQKLAKAKEKEINKYSAESVLAYADVVAIYDLSKNIEELYQEYTKKGMLVDNINLVISKLMSLKTNESEQKKIEELENQKYKNTEKTLTEITKLYNDVIDRQEKDEDIYVINFKNKIDGLIELGRKTGAIDENEINALNELSFSPNNTKKLEIIEAGIVAKIEDRAKEQAKFIQYFKNLDIKEIDAVVEQVNYLYSGIGLKELYDIKYYPPITLHDAERLSKKKNFLQTATLNQLFSKFETNFQENKFTESINLIDKSTIERLIDLNKEYWLIKQGIKQIQADANKEIVDIQNKFTKDKANAGKIASIIHDFENQNYLLVIRNARVLKQPLTNKTKINYQIIVMAFVLALCVVGYFRYNKKQKTITKEEKKQKILRHY